jgi:hypothetical protein
MGCNQKRQPTLPVGRNMRGVTGMWAADGLGSTPTTSIARSRRPRSGAQPVACILAGKRIPLNGPEAPFSSVLGF